MFSNRALRVFFEPRAVFVAAAEPGGVPVVFFLVALELAMTRPKLWVGALMRAPGAPLVAAATLVQAYLDAVAGPVGMLLMAALAYHLLARLRGRGADLWMVLAALSYAWAPHTGAVAAWVCLRGSGLSPVEPVGAPAWLLWVPGAWGALALVTLWRKGALPSRPAPLPPPSPRAKAGAAAAGLAAAAAAVSVLHGVHLHWASLRPKLCGDVVPAFCLEGINRGPLRSAQLAGQVTLIDFWATWCGPCMQAMPELERLHQRYGPQGLRVVAVNIEAGNRPSIESFIAAQHLSLPVYQDPQHLADAMHVQVYPTSFLVDAQGRIARVYSGPADAADLSRRIDMLLAAAAPARPAD